MSSHASDGPGGLMPDAPDASAESPPRPPPVTIDGTWEPWYAWHPVKLYMSSQLAWLCWIHRRAIHRSGMAMWDYTDRPELHGDPPME